MQVELRIVVAILGALAIDRCVSILCLFTVHVTVSTGGLVRSVSLLEHNVGIYLINISQFVVSVVKLFICLFVQVTES